MAEIIIPILRIASILGTCNGNNTWYLCDLQENKDALVTAMEELKNTRDDVKRKVVEAENNPNGPMECNKEVSGWLEHVQAIEGDVVQVLLKADKEIKGRCIGGYCSKNCWSASKTGKRVIQKLAIVKDLRSQRISFVDVAHKLPPPLVQKKAVELTLGMESKFEKVWRWLADDEVRIMGLYGYGGVGKTTLLKQINNAFLQSTATSSSSSNHGFDVVILVVVSKVINIDAIQKVIGDRLGLLSPNEDNIRNALSKKNFLLLLDDIWEKVDLPSIGIPPSHENNKSKVVFTTRSETVCGLMEANEMLKVECLSWNEAWSLFQEKVGERALNSFPRARELAEVVAKECGGLPLALITIGRAMSTKKALQEWNHAITTLRRSASEFPGMGDEVLPLLKLSYDSLRNETIKCCFLYCALFPEDHSIDKTKLIDYWIGEELISLNEFDHIDEARNKGYDVIGILKGASLLESGVDEETQVKMHDTIRDLALWIAHDCESSSIRDKMLIIKTSDLTGERSRYYNAERIYLRLSPHDGETEVVRQIHHNAEGIKSRNLITLIRHHFHYRFEYRDLFVLPQNFFEFTPLLRVLDLSGSNMETFPISITELVELRYLSLSSTNIKELPEELGKLVKLNYLDLSHMSDLQKIPSGVIGSLLLELRVLSLYDCYPVWDIKELYKLKHLNHLGITITSQPDLEKLLSNKNLQMCTRGLTLYNSEYVKPQSILEKLLQLLFNLETLVLLLEFPEAEESMNMGIEQQQHLGRSCFQNLIEIEISRCNGLKDLTWVCFVPNLKRLTVSACKELEEIVIVGVDDFGGGGDAKDVFKRLRVLLMFGLPKLKSICRSALAFPCLEKMDISRCPELKKLPFDSASNVNNTLGEIVGGPKWWSELQWEEEEGHNNNNNNNNNELLKSKFLPYFVKVERFDVE